MICILRDDEKKYLFAFVEDYVESSGEEEKDKIFKEFCQCLWSSKNKRRVYKKSIHFKVQDKLLNTELGELFNAWSKIEYTSYKSFHTHGDWCEIIRQKINNIYTIYFDKQVITRRKYMNLLKRPKNLYFSWIDGNPMDTDYVIREINQAMSEAEQIKEQYQKEKMDLSWNEYKKLIESFLKKIFNNIQSAEEYEEEHGWYLTPYSFITEDNLYMKYINKCLDGEIKKWQKKYYGVREHKKYRRCTNCGCLYETAKHDYSSKFCPKCRRQRRLEDYKRYNKKRITT